MNTAPAPVLRAVASFGLALASAVFIHLPSPLATEQGDRWIAVLDLSVGGESDSVNWFSRPTDLAVGQDGRFYILDSAERTLRVFDGQGRSTGSIGRRGSGPGEFEGPSALGWHADTLWVSDTRLLRLSLFTPDGEFIRSHNTYWQGSGQAFPTSVQAILEDKSLLGLPRVSAVAAGDASRTPVLRLDVDGVVQDTLLLLSEENRVVQISCRGATYFREQPFADGNLWGVSSDGRTIALVDRPAADQATESHFRVTRLTPGGDTVFTNPHVYQPKRIADYEIESIMSTISRRLVRICASEPAAEQAVRAALYLPKYHPPVTAVVVGRDGTTWLRREMTVDSDSVLWMVLDGAGNSIGEVQLSTGTRVLEADREFVWGSETMSLGAPYVVRYRLMLGHADR